MLDGDDDIKLGVWDGVSWGNQFLFIDTSLKVYKVFDIAYDSYTGDAFVFGWNINKPGIVDYTYWDGSSWAASSQAFTTGTGRDISFIDAEGSPTNGEILIGVLDVEENITLHRWDGSTFAQLSTLENNATTDQWMGFTISYEQQSGEALIVWGNDNSASCRYVTWDGSTLSPTASLPSFGDATVMVRAAADPTSDTIVLLGVDDQEELHAAVWDGSSWIDSRRLETSVEQQAIEYMNFDVAWESTGAEAIIAWGRSSTNRVNYTRWTKGTALADCTIQTGPNFMDRLRAMHLCPLPDSDKIVIVCNNQSTNLRYSFWNGEQFLGDPAVLLTPNQPSERWLAFDVTFPEYLTGPTVAALPNPSLAFTKMYWADYNDRVIECADLDGSNKETLVSSGINSPHGIALDADGGKMYWTEESSSHRIQRANLDGSNRELLLDGATVDYPMGIALDVDAGKMYWADDSTSRIQRANLDGSNVQTLVSGLDAPHGIALDVRPPGKIYWIDEGASRIQCASLNGSNVQTLVSSWSGGLDAPHGIALDVEGGKMYWTDEGTSRIQCANLDGSNVQTLLSSWSGGLDAPHGIALDVEGGKMYWTDRSARRIQRANLDGSNVETLIGGWFSGLDRPYGIALK
jgi:sugar lactone lactonase YvrE